MEVSLRRPDAHRDEGQQQGQCQYVTDRRQCLGQLLKSKVDKAVLDMPCHRLFGAEFGAVLPCAEPVDWAA